MNAMSDARTRPRRLVVLAAAAAFAGLACAGDEGAQSAASPSAPETRKPMPPEVLAAQAVVLRFQAAMLEVMKQAQTLGFEGRYARLEGIARQSFDLPQMARQSFGPGFRNLTPEQQALWIRTFERFHISAVADIRDRYSGQVYRQLGWDRPLEGVVLIRTQLDYPGRAVDVHIDYRLRRTPKGWRIVDVLQPPTVSEVAMRRAEYRTVLERSGFDGLVAEMERQIERRKAP